MEIKRKIFISGINGQDGPYLAKFLLDLDYEIHGSVREEKSSLSNLKFLNLIDKINLHVIDLENFYDLTSLLNEIDPSYIINLAAQSSVGMSFEKPFETLRPNITILLNFLEYIRLNSHIRFYQSSSSEMYGNPKTLPILESHELNPISPYGLSKSIGHHLLAMYRNLYNLYLVNGIMFNHESILRRESFFIKKVISQSINISRGIQEYLEVGNLEVKRDFGLAKDYVEAIYLSLTVDKPDDYIICSGNSTSLKEIIYYVFNKLGITLTRLKITDSLFRPSEIYDIYGDNLKAKNLLGWSYSKSIWDLLDILIDEELTLIGNIQTSTDKSKKT